MAEKVSAESILSRLDDMSGRLATAKNLSDVQEAIGRLASAKSVIELQETLTKVLADQKGLRNEMAELRETQEKALRKLREEVLEAVENVEVEGDEESAETNKLIKESIGEVKGLLGHLFGDEEVIKAARGRIKNWILKDGKKKILGGGDDAD